MKFMKDLALELIPAMLVAMVAGVGAYVAVKGDITELSVNQGIILQEIKDGNQEDKEFRQEQYLQGIRLARVEEKVR